MDSTALIALFRSEIADPVAPYLWSDAEAYSFADDAQKMFCRYVGGIGDSTNAGVTQIVCAIATPTVVLSPLILKIRGAYNVADGKPVTVLNYENMEKFGMRWDAVPGTVKALVTGMDDNKVRPWPLPSVAMTVQLVVDRLPLADITGAGQAIEIDTHHHRSLLMHMKSRAYEKQDAETFDKSKSKEFDEKFQAYCGKAKLEQERRRHKPRSITYGGLPMSSIKSFDDYRR